MEYNKEDIFNLFAKNVTVEDIKSKYNIDESTIEELQKEYFVICKETSKKIRDLINENKLLKASILCLKYPYDSVIQSQYITILVKQKKINEAIDICKSFPDDENVQSQYIKILISYGKYNEAINICESFPNNPVIQSQYIKILTKCKKFDEAISLCKKFPNQSHIQSQYITILKKLNRLEEAIEICSLFPEDEGINYQRKTIEKALVEGKNISLKENKKDSVSNKSHHKTSETLLNSLREIRDNTFSENGVESLELTIFQKKLLLIIDAYKRNLPDSFIETKIKELKLEYQNNSKALNAIKNFLQLIKNSKQFFDIRKFGEILSIKI